MLKVRVIVDDAVELQYLRRFSKGDAGQVTKLDDGNYTVQLGNGSTYVFQRCELRIVGDNENDN